MTTSGSISKEEYRPLYGEPADYVVEAHAPFLEETSQRFISACTLMLLPSQNEDGFIDMSPRGGDPGFIQIVDDRHIVFLDQPGNKKLHTIGNLAERTKVGLLFMIPGVTEVLRAYGTACAVHDEPAILAMGGNPKHNKCYIRIRIEKIFPHCSKALNNANLWQPDNWPTQLAEQIPDVRGLGASIRQAREDSEAAATGNPQS